MPAGDHWSSALGSLSDLELEALARDYVWLMDNAAGMYEDRLADVVAEAERRGIADLVERAKQGGSVKRTKRGAAGRR